MRRGRVLIVATIVALVAAGCSWGQYGHDASRAGWSPAEKVLTTTNVAQLKPMWRTAANGGWGAQIDNGLVYAIDIASTTKRLVAYQADGSVGCSGTSPRVCTPKWSAPLATSMYPDDATHGAYAVANDRVYVVGFLPGFAAWRLEVFDAHGEQGCGGTPKTCTPLWTATWGSDADGGATLAVANSRIYVSTPTIPNGVTVFDANGVQGCTSGATKTCSSLFSTAGPSGGGTFAVDATHIVVTAAGGLKVFDALGTTGCNAGVCGPTRTYTGLGFPSLSGSTAYAGFGAADLTSTTGCTGAPPSCPVTWSTALSGGTFAVAPAVAAGRLLVPGAFPSPTSTFVEAFDAAGQQGCSGNPRTCTPVARFDTNNGSPQGVSATGTLLFASSAATPGSPAKVMAWDLAATAGCTGAVPQCVPLWTGLIDSSLIGFPAAPSIVDGIVAVSGSNGGIQTFVVPQSRASL